MPCDSSGYSSGGMTYEEARRLRKVEAILCGVLRAVTAHLGDTAMVFGAVSWEDAGVTEQEAIRWWNEHVAKDNKRKTT